MQVAAEGPGLMGQAQWYEVQQEQVPRASCSLYFGYKNPMQLYGLGAERLESSPVGKDLDSSWQQLNLS